MNRTHQLRSRACVLGLLLFSVSVSIITVAMRPANNDRLNTPRPLPATLNLSGWHLKQKTTIPPVENQDIYDRVLHGQRYQYRRHHSQKTRTPFQIPQQSSQAILTIELRDMIATESDIGTLQQKHLGTQFQDFAIEDKTLAAGQYRLFHQANTTTLHTCISPSDQLTVEAAIFQQHSYQQVLSWSNITHWFLGQRRLLNDRCLWVRITTNATRPAPLLEQVWQQIYPQLTHTPQPTKADNSSS